MSFLRHITVTLFAICIIAAIIIIVGGFLDDSLLTMKRHFQFTEQQLYPDSLTLLNLWHFKYIINNDVCTSNDTNTLTTILIVTSHAGDIEGRNSIRLAYPREELSKLGIRRVFLLALINTQSKDNKYKSVPQSEILNENEHFSDLVQGNFYEAYRNLTYKHAMGLKWAVTFCQKAKFIIKMDDDIIVDFYRLTDIIKSTEVTATEMLTGYVLRGMKPIRDKSNKWFVTNKEYAKVFYPPFLSGWMYVTTPQTAEKLLQASKSINFFWIDDTYITGILAKVAGIKHMDISDIFTVHPEYLDCCLDGNERRKYSCDFIVGPSGGNYELLLRFQKHAVACYMRKCPNRELAKSLKKKCISKGKPLLLQKGKGKIMPYHLV